MDITTPKVSDFSPGQRVQLHPATDTWMRGDRYGQVIHLGRKLVLVELERSGRRKRIHPTDLLAG